jgi:ABC-type lipoprotein export system ATPase subunit
MNRLFEISNLKCSYDKVYVPGRSKVVLEIDKLDLPKGKKIFIVGESGIGKSTILEVLGMMNNTIIPDKDTKFVFYEEDDKPVDLLELWHRNSDKELSRFRLKHFNFIFQSTNLMRNFTAYENISLTRMLQGYSQESAFHDASKVLSDLGLSHIDESRMAQELSGGQQQRLAFARAILPDFTVLFGDEPTGNLDSDNAMNAMKLLSKKLKSLEGSSAIIVSHDMHLAVSYADVIVKVHKEMRTERDIHGEFTFYGKIDPSCVYTPAEGGKWSNGESSYTPADFEQFLKGRIA